MIGQWNVNLQVDGAGETTGPASRCFVVQSRTASMALEKAAQQARQIGLQIVAVASCNPVNDSWTIGRR